MPTTLIATALPHSLADDASFQLSVFFTHKLVSGGDTVAGYPAAADWVDVLKGCKLSLTVAKPSPIGHLPSVRTYALRIVSKPDADSWHALLPSTLGVTPFPEPKLSRAPIHSNPASRMSEHAIDVQLAAIASSPGMRPAVSGNPIATGILTAIAERLDREGPVAKLRSREPSDTDASLLRRRFHEALATLGPLDGPKLNQRGDGHREDPWPDRGTALDGILHDPDADRRVSERLDALIGQDLSDQPYLRLLVDAHAMRRYYEPPAGNHPAPQRPDPPEPDFHSRVASFGAVPALLRRLGLVADVVIDAMTPTAARGALRDALWVSIAVDSNHTDLNVIPARKTAVQVDGATFQAKSSNAWVDGALPLGEPEWVVLDADPDAAGLKLDQYLRDLPRQYAAELNGDPATAAPATVRATGFSLARVDRASQFRDRLTQAEDLDIRPGQPLMLDDLVRGYRLEVWDDHSQQWHSLHRRRVDVTGAPGGERVLADATDIGFVQASGLNQRHGELYLHEVIAGWDGWSLSAPRPGRIVERVPEPGIDKPTERMADTPSDPPLEGAHIVTRVEPGSLPRLRYGTSYSFRVLAVDLAGNSTPQPSSSVLDGPGLAEHITRLQTQFDDLDSRSLAAHTQLAEPVEGHSSDGLRSLLHAGEPAIDDVTRNLLDAAMAPPANGLMSGVAAAAQALQKSGRPIRVRQQLSSDVLKRLTPGHDRPGPLKPIDRPLPKRVTVTLPREYLRWEPVGPPAIVAREELDPGEQLSVLVVRSGGQTDRQQSERHLVPPKATQLEVETTGLFDDAIGTGDTAAIRRRYAISLVESGTLLDEKIPSLTDPLASRSQPGIRLATRPGANPEQPSLSDLARDRGRGLAEGQYVVHDTDQLQLPYLPEPFADGVSLVFYEAGDDHQLTDPSNLQTVRVPYPGSWPETTPLRLMVERGDRLDATVAGHVVRVTLPPGEQVRVAMASTLDSASLERFGLWRSYHASLADPSDGYVSDEEVAMAIIRRAAISGWLWWLTPTTPLRLVHAVPTPVRAPTLRGLRVLARPRDRGVAALAGLVDVHGPSTDTLVVRAEWSEPTDDPEQAIPTVESKSDIVVRSAVGEGERTGILHLVDQQIAGSDIRSFGLHKAIQNFPDTHRRLVTYYPGGTTRYAEYFTPSELPDAPVEGVPVQLDIASSARPAAPIVLDTVPLLRWSGEPEPGSPFAWRRTRSPGIRIWLARPWFSSGEGELLGVLVFDRYQQVLQSDGSWVQAERQLTPPDGATSLWGADPILRPGGRIAEPTVPPLLGPEHLILDGVTAMVPGTGGIAPPVVGADAKTWPLGPAQPVSVTADVPLVDVVRGSGEHPLMRVIGYQPEFDPDSRRWFVDLALQDTPVATPFVRLAVARWQPHSLPGCELSAVALTTWVQPLPERRLTVNRPDVRHIQVTISGVMARLRSGAEFDKLPAGLLSADSPVGDGAARAARLLQSRTVAARLQRLPDGGTDLEWTTVASVQLVPAQVDERRTQEATWTGSLTIPNAYEISLRRPASSDSNWRVLVEEHELLDADSFDGSANPRQLPRLVYADEVRV